ncbi:glycosyltransferase [Vibrio breoganii]
MSNIQNIVTVYITTKNRSQLLVRALDSVLNQDYESVEIIVIDDGSDDDTQKIMSQYVLENENLIYIRNELSLGANVSRNKAITLSNGKFITGLDDDDYFFPNRVSRFVEFWNDGDGVACLFDNSISFDKNNRKNVRLRPKIVNYKNLFSYNYIGNQMFTKTDYLKEINGFDESLKSWQDLDCWLRLLQKFGVAKNINRNSYCIDDQHMHDRITNKNINIMRDSCATIMSKHKYIYKTRLLYQLSSYNDYYSSLIKAPILSLIKFDLKAAKLFTRSLLRLLKNTIL